MHWNDDVAWWGWLMMSLGMLVFWGLLAWGAVVLLRGRGETASADRPSPQEILDERLARGEIDARERAREGADRAQARRAQDHREPLRPVRQGHREGVAAAQARLGEARGRRSDPSGELAEGPFEPRRPHGRLLLPAREPFVEEECRAVHRRLGAV